MNRNIHKTLRDTVFNEYQETVWVFLKKTNTKGSNYDPYRNTGYTTSRQSPEPVKAYVRQVRGDSLIARELGLVNSGAIEIVIKASDENLFRISDRVKYNDTEYTPFNKALGDRVQIYKSDFSFVRVVLFRRG